MLLLFSFVLKIIKSNTMLKRISIKCLILLKLLLLKKNTWYCNLNSWCIMYFFTKIVKNALKKDGYIWVKNSFYSIFVYNQLLIIMIIRIPDTEVLSETISYILIWYLHEIHSPQKILLKRISIFHLFCSISACYVPKKLM